MRNVTDKVVEKLETCVACSITSFRKLCLLWDSVETYFTGGQATGYKIAHAHCWLDTKDYKHTLRICNTYRISTATMVVTARLSVTLCYIACLVDSDCRFQNLYSAHNECFIVFSFLFNLLAATCNSTARSAGNPIILSAV
jgi:hypothetical protein